VREISWLDSRYRIVVNVIGTSRDPRKSAGFL
jgi:hypothetical protein